VIRSAWLIAGREFRTYAATWSFWLALLLGPLLLGGALLAASGPPAAVQFAVASSDPQLAAAARRAVAEALTVEGQRVASGAEKGANLHIQSVRSGGAILTFDQDFPLTPSGRMLVLRTLEAQRAAARTTPNKAAAAPLVLAPSPPDDLTQASRFAVVMMLWLSLTGSLGMLLQAVVRERSNRALETLLASAGPWAIVLGKVAGVGLVSILVLGAWLGSAGIAAALAPQSANVLPALLQAMGNPLLLGRAGLIYLLAYAFYGLLTVAIGALARDSASAQNLARPMFLVLLVAFFIVFSSAGGEKSGLSWLLYVPPFSPFILLMQPASLAAELAACALLVVSAGAAGWVATILLRGALGGRLTGGRTRG
jgi:ABC-2 type transport system permease protein